MSVAQASYRRDDCFIYLKFLCANGRLLDAIRSAETLHKQGIRVPLHILFHLLKSCISEEDISLGRKLHALIINSGLGESAFLGSHLIRMFSSCHSLSDAKQAFLNLPTHTHTVFTWYAIISALVKHDKWEEAIALYHSMCKFGFPLDRHILLSTLKACSCSSTIEHGRQIHSKILKLGFELDLLICNTLVAMYIKSASIDDAHLVFLSIPEKDVVTWNALISGYARHGRGFEALHLVMEMYRNGCEPTLVTFLCILKACASILALHEGRLIHVLLMKNCLDQERFVGSSLIDLYTKCGSFRDAHRVFDKFQTQDVATWNTIIQTCAHQGLGSIALEFFQEMQKKGFNPDNVTFLSILKACSSLPDLEQIKVIDTHVRRCNLQQDAYVLSTLIDMYVKSGCIENATEVFNISKNRDSVTWNTMIGGWVQREQIQEALRLFQKMQLEGIRPDTLTYISLLKASFSAGSLDIGRLIHSCIIGAGLENELLLENSIVDMYSKFGSMNDAQNLFRKLHSLDLVSWNTLISGFAQHEHNLEAFQTFQSMQQQGLKPDKVTMSLMLKACSSKAFLDHGKLVHAQIIESGFESDALIESTLIDSYAKCCSLDDARGVFFRASKQNVHAWNVLISGYAHCGESRAALEVFEDMQQDMIQPNETTIISVLQGCSTLEVHGPVMVVNDLIIRKEFEHDVFVMSALVDVYAKHGNLDEAVSIFMSIPSPGVVTWTGLISGHVQHGNGLKALQLFYRMQSRGIKPNEATFVCAVRACIILESLKQGRLVHDSLIREVLECNQVVGSALINLYAMCGSMEDALKVFSALPSRDMVTWNVIIAGRSHLNDYEMALQHLDEMRIQGVKPDDVTFVSLLASCSHMGLLNEGCDMFDSIGQIPLTSQRIDHFNCLIDLFGRAGHLGKAEDLLHALPSSHSSLGWRSLLGHCQTHCDVQLGRRCFDGLVELGVADAAVYKLMSNIYSRAGMWEDAEMVKRLRPSSISVEEQSRMHDVGLADQNHAIVDTSSYKLVLGRLKEESIPLSDTLLDEGQISPTSYLAVECG